MEKAEVGMVYISALHQYLRVLASLLVLSRLTKVCLEFGGSWVFFEQVLPGSWQRPSWFDEADDSQFQAELYAGTCTTVTPNGGKEQNKHNSSKRRTVLSSISHNPNSRRYYFISLSLYKFFLLSSQLVHMKLMNEKKCQTLSSVALLCEQTIYKLLALYRLPYLHTLCKNVTCDLILFSSSRLHYLHIIWFQAKYLHDFSTEHQKVGIPKPSANSTNTESHAQFRNWLSDWVSA